MFVIPDAKRVKRSHLFQDKDDAGSKGSPKSSRHTSPTGGEDISYGFEYDFVTAEPQQADDTATSEVHIPVIDNEETDEPEYQFRLFSSAPNIITQDDTLEGNISKARIKLSATPEPVALAESLSLENSHFVHPNRPESYYFTSNLQEDQIQHLKFEYEAAAISTVDVLLLASTRWLGTALPWRVIQVRLANKPTLLKNQNVPSQSKSTSNDQTPSRNRTRPSKKRRILLRQRLALRRGLAAQAKVAAETEQEKRTRRNREKKVKKKEREKRKKLEAGGVAEEGCDLESKDTQVVAGVGGRPKDPSRDGEKVPATAVDEVVEASMSRTPAIASKVRPTAKTKTTTPTSASSTASRT